MAETGVHLTFCNWMRQDATTKRICRMVSVVNSTVSMKSKEIAQRAFGFSCKIVKLHERLESRGGAARRLAGQVLNSGTSIGANLEEATAGQTKPDFIAKVSVARKEARETVYWLRLLVATELVRRGEVAWELNEAEQFVAILGSIVFNARSSPYRGRLR